MDKVEKREINRVLLIYPPVINAKFTNNICELPLGIASLASYIRDQVEVFTIDCALEGYHNIKALDKNLVQFGLSLNEIVGRIEEIKPDLIGISCLFSSQFPIIRELVERIKKLSSDIITVSGGTYPSFEPRHCLKSSKLDFIVIGEGEIPFKELIQALREGKSKTELKAIAFRDGDEIYVNQEREFVRNLDELPFPARDLFPLEKYFQINIPMQSLSRSRRNLAISTSRGCPYRCQFCSSTIHWGNRFRARSVENIVAELWELKQKYNVEEIKFEDDNLTTDREKTKRLFREMIEQGFQFKWNTPNGIAVWTLDEEVIELAKASGCYELTIAPESGDEYVLKNIVRKPVDLNKTKQMVKLIKNYNIETNGYFIIGFPGETKEQILNTIEYARSLELDRCYIFIYTPLPGTPLSKLAFEQGKLKDDYDFEDANNYFVPRLHLSQVCPDELKKIHRRAFWSINLKFLFSHPLRFIKKYANTLKSHPEFVLKFFRSLFQ